MSNRVADIQQILSTEDSEFRQWVEEHHTCESRLSELANNSLRHGGGRGRVRIWTQAGSLVCEVTDRGRIARALADRERPPAGVEGARGLWLVNQLCDLLQLRATAQGTVARLHMRLG